MQSGWPATAPVGSSPREDNFDQVAATRVRDAVRRRYVGAGRWRGSSTQGEQMAETSSAADGALRARLEGAAEGLTYGSESDRPFEFFFLPGAGDQPPG